MEKINYISSGNTLLDIQLGGDTNIMGYRLGRIYNIVGDSSTCKTFMCCEMLAYNIHKYKEKLKWVYDDCESGFTFDSKKLYGVNLSQNKEKSQTVEKALYNITKFQEGLKKDEIGIYIVDSLDGLTAKATEERIDDRIKAEDKGEEFKDGTYAMDKQKFLSGEFFPRISEILEENGNVLLIIISQVREKIGVFFGEKLARSGGRALNFYSHTVNWLAVTETLEKNGLAAGVVIKIKSKKSKTPRPYREVFITFLYDYGMDDTASCVDFLFDMRTEKGSLKEKFLKKQKEKKDDEKKENLLTFKDIAAQTRDLLIRQIEEKNYQSDLRFETTEKWEERERSILSNRLPKFGDLGDLQKIKKGVSK